VILKTAGIVVFLGALALSEDPASTPEPVPLTPRTAKALDLPVGPMAIPIRCSLDGDLAVRTIEGFDESLLYVGGNGSTTRRVKFSDARLKHRSLLDFTAVGNGRIYALFSGADRPSAPVHSFIVKFDRNGTVEEVREIFPKIQPWQFTVLPDTGEIVVAGVAISNVGGRMRRQTMELLDAHGQPKHEIKLDDDLKPLKDEESIPGRRLEDEQRQKLEQFEQAIFSSTLMHDEAGNLMLQRGGDNQPIFVFSPQGKLLRKIKPPEFRKDAVLIEFRYAQRRLIWRFIVISREEDAAAQSKRPRRVNTEAVYFIETDAQTGDVVRSYASSDAPLLGPLGCYSPGVLSFLSGGKNGMELVIADLR
jgi:hypothetical protein